MKSKIPKKKITLETIAHSIVKLDEGLNKKIDDLALATAKGFESVDKRFESVDKKFEFINDRFNRLETKINQTEKTLSKKIDGLDGKVDDLAFHKVRDEVYTLTQRVVRVERKVGVKA